MRQNDMAKSILKHLLSRSTTGRTWADTPNIPRKTRISRLHMGVFIIPPPASHRPPGAGVLGVLGVGVGGKNCCETGSWEEILVKMLSTIYKSLLLSY